MKLSVKSSVFHLKFFLTCSIFICLLSTHTVAQRTGVRFAVTGDAVIDSAGRRIPSKSCNQWSSYLPDTLHPAFLPVRHVRVNVHVIQDANGENNFRESEGRTWVKDMIRNANQRLDENQKMWLPHGNNTPVLPVPFRWVLAGELNNPADDGIYFHRDDSLFCMNKKARGKQVNSVYDMRQYKVYGIQKDSVINFFLIEHSPDSTRSATYKASHDGVGMGNWAKLAGSYYLWTHPRITEKGDTFKFTPWDAAALLNHELAHCLGLQHTWNQEDGCDDTPKNPGCWNFNEPAGCQDVSNNVMDYNAYKNAFSPCQIGKMYQRFYEDKNSRKYLIPEWCHYDSSKSVTIGGGETIEWNGSRDVYGDLIIKNKATLIVHCTLSLPPGGKIILYPKATLILDGCILTSRCNDSFAGIQIMTKKKSKPVIHLKNGAVIENVSHPL